MPNSSSIRPLQEQIGRELVAELVQGVATAELEAALLDERYPLAKDLQTAVSVAVDAGRKLSRQIVAAALEGVLREREGDGRR
ncbi:hypothetical protein [Anaerolinea sp.]|uniref:hypothetical protein n=1 Tax=Anaerolinea sp. TaxID=1872519 RepID=UPI002ACDF1D2|nr:hypothetical protein [Anaerolinea sp.]